MTQKQIDFPLPDEPKAIIDDPEERLKIVLSNDLDFHNQNHLNNAVYNFHSFPAKFPPQIPKLFIQQLTEPGEVVLDPMAGSGTTLIESKLSGRYGIGFDIDPLSLLMTKVKLSHFNSNEILEIAHSILKNARDTFASRTIQDFYELYNWDKRTIKFANYWFAKYIQKQLFALISEIDSLHGKYRHFFRLIFSSLIITKHGGVSYALDLAHTRPHRAKVVYDEKGNLLLDGDLSRYSERRREILTKTIKAPFEVFLQKVKSNIKSVLPESDTYKSSYVSYGDAQSIPLQDDHVDLIITSPPYASMAIDYMRAHKFSLIWFGHSINSLGNKRSEYLGGDAIQNVEYETMPNTVKEIIETVAKEDQKKGKTLHRYYSEMTRVLQECFRVLKPGKSAIFVVGTSTMRGIDTQIDQCLAHIGQSLGFIVPKIAIRYLDRNKRMLPVGDTVNKSSMIQNRMHTEQVIGFLKP